MTTPGQPVQLFACNAHLTQKWAFTPSPGQGNADLGVVTVYDQATCLAPAAGTAGSAVTVADCSGAAGQQWRRVPATGQLIHQSSGLCAAVSGAGAVTANSTPVVLAACVTGSSVAAQAQSWLAQDTTRHIYGPGGTQGHCVVASEVV